MVLKEQLLKKYTLVRCMLKFLLHALKSARLVKLPIALQKLQRSRACINLNTFYYVPNLNKN